MIRITILQALVEQKTVGIGSGRGRAEGRESAQRRLDVAEVQRHALSLRSPEAIASHLSLLLGGVMVRPKTHSRLALSGQAPSAQS